MTMFLNIVRVVSYQKKHKNNDSDDDHDHHVGNKQNNDSTNHQDIEKNQVNVINNNNNKAKSIPIYLGRRYSYNTFSTNSNEYFYDYLTGGAGILINDETAKRIYECKECTCPSTNSSMDDMIFGKWAKELGILAINFEGYFQNSPLDYNKKYINTLVPITYHRLNKK